MSPGKKGRGPKGSTLIQSNDLNRMQTLALLSANMADHQKHLLLAPSRHIGASDCLVSTMGATLLHRQWSYIIIRSPSPHGVGLSPLGTEPTVWPIVLAPDEYYCMF
jgi:hypothetical protein